MTVSVTPFLMHKIPILAEMIKMYKTDYVYPLDNGYYVKITEIYKGEIYPSIQALEGEDFKQLCERENYYQIPKSNVCIYGDKLFMVFSDILYEIDQAKHFIGIRRFNIENVQFLDKGIVAKTKIPDRNDLLILIDPYSDNENVVGKYILKDTHRK